MPSIRPLFSKGTAAAALSLLGCGLWLWFALAQMGSYQSGPSLSKEAATSELRVMLGRAAPGAAQSSIAGFDDTGAAMVAWPSYGGFDAQRFPILSISWRDVPPGLAASLSWRTEQADGVEHQIRLQAVNNRAQDYFLGAHPAWRGRVIEVAIYLFPEKSNGRPMPLETPIVLDRLSLFSDSWSRRLMAQWTAWSGADPWSLRSINSVDRYPSQLEYLRLTPFLAGCWVIAVLVVLGFWRPPTGLVGARRAAVIAMPFIVLLSLQQLSSLVAQRAATERQFGALSHQQRQLQLADFELYRLAQDVRAKLPDRKRRLWIVAADPFVQHRLRWHLQAQNSAGLSNFPRRSAAERLRPGDCVLLHQAPTLLDGVLDGDWSGVAIELTASLLYRANDHGLVCLESDQ